MMSKYKTLPLTICYCHRFFATRSTIDPKQMLIFNQLSKEWWDINGHMKPLHDLNNFRVSWIQNRLTTRGVIKPNGDIQTPLKGLSILDVGCGGGILSESVGLLGGNVVGLDANSEMINIAKMRAREQNLSNLQYFLSTIEEHASENREKYDVVVASEVIEHVKEQELFVKKCVECLKPGGSFFLTTNSKTWFSKFVFITLFENIIRIVPKGTHEYDMFIEGEEVKRFLENEKCEVVLTTGLMYNPFKSKWYMIQNYNLLHYAIHAVKQDKQI